MTDLHDGTTAVMVGDVRERLRELPDESVHCVVTSPPYWGLRDYACEGQLGLEPTPDLYVENMVGVFREVRRVLRADGTCWLNLGDSYAATHHGKGGNSTSEVFNDPGDAWRENVVNERREFGALPAGLKPKDLVGIPWRVAFALQADGWYLRADIIWSKPNPMPESVSDRPTKAHEYLFLLTKGPRYFYDADAIREPHSPDGRKDTRVEKGDGSIQHRNGERWPGSGRNRRSVWEIATEPYPEAHFATYPTALVEPCVKAGTSERGCCPVCGAPFVREIEKGELRPVRGNYLGEVDDLEGRKTSGTAEVVYKAGRAMVRTDEGWSLLKRDTKTVGWLPSCGCYDDEVYHDHPSDGTPIPCTVLDPFAGSGTTLLVARRLGRRGVGVELSPEYAALIPRRFGSLWGQLSLLDVL